MLIAENVLNIIEGCYQFLRKAIKDNTECISSVVEKDDEKEERIVEEISSLCGLF
ncbi:MAG: hypothetical protein U9R53_10300 [Chloroflexota bacterium]|nr:hypothetical protein [Chloroflexota bacterium]